MLRAGLRSRPGARADRSRAATLTCGVPTMLLAVVGPPRLRTPGPVVAAGGERRRGGGPGRARPPHRRNPGRASSPWSSARPRRRGSSPRPISTTAAKTKAPRSGRRCRAWRPRVVDPDSGAVVPRGEVGELEVRGPERHGRLPRPARRDRGDHPTRGLVAHRRPRDDGRAWLSADDRSAQGDDRVGRREHLPGRDRERAPRASRRGPGGGGGRARRTVGRSGGGA